MRLGQVYQCDRPRWRYAEDGLMPLLNNLHFANSKTQRYIMKNVISVKRVRSQNLSRRLILAKMTDRNGAKQNQQDFLRLILLQILTL